jgi:hypothetical protein
MGKMAVRGDWGEEGAMTGVDRKGQSEDFSPALHVPQLSPKSPKSIGPPPRAQPTAANQWHRERACWCCHSNTGAVPAALRMPSSTPSKKHIQISSSLTTTAEVLHEEIHDNKTGQTKTITHDTPRETSHTTTITTNPYTVETNGAERKTKQGGSTTLDLDPSHCPATVGYDTSQL